MADSPFIHGTTRKPGQLAAEAASPALTRRELIAGAGIFAMAGALPAMGAAAPAGSEWLPGGQADSWRHTIRLQGSLRAEDVVWWYTGRIYAQVGDGAPQHLFNLEGTEIYWYRPLDDGSFSMSSRTLTFFRDKDSGAMLRTYDNPFTGETVAVDANRLGGRDGSQHSAAGMRFTSQAFNPTGESLPWHVEWHRSEDSAWFTSSRFLTAMPQPWLECMTVFTPLDGLLDTSRPNLPAHFTSVYLAPWPRWMNMGDHDGHMVWHSSGRKLSSAAHVPEEYRRRVDSEYGGVLTANPDSFDAQPAMH